MGVIKVPGGTTLSLLVQKPLSDFSAFQRLRFPDAGAQLFVLAVF